MAALPQGVLDALDAANAMIAENARVVDAALIDIAGAFRGREAILLTSDMEPTLAGARVIATLFLQEIRRIGLLGA